jgi:hypothetical protein
VHDCDRKTYETKLKQDLWEKLEVPKKEFVEAYMNMINIIQSPKIIDSLHPSPNKDP